MNRKRKISSGKTGTQATQHITTFFNSEPAGKAKDDLTR